jgi:glycosyl transferase family 87
VPPNGRERSGPRTPDVGGSLPARALELAGLGAALVACMVALAAAAPWRAHLGAAQGLLVLAFALYAVALRAARRWERLPRVAVAVTAVAFAMRAAVLPTPPSLSDDLYRYVWEGRVVAAGGNPYARAPLDPALAPLRDRVVWPRVNHPELATIYPPLAEAGFALVARLSPTVLAMKAWVMLHDVALVAVLAAWLAARGLSPVWALVWGWNPLLVAEYAGSGHNDPTALVWLAMAMLLAERRPVLSALALAAGALVKLAPLAALPLLWRAWPARARVAAAVPLTAGLGAFLWLARHADSGLLAYWERWRNNALVFEYLERWTGRFVVARTVAVVLLAVVMIVALVRRRRAEDGARVIYRAGVLLSPVAHPWYIGWPLLFEPFAPSAPWLLLSCTMLLAYGIFAPPPEGGGFHLSLAWRWVEYGLPLGVAVAIAIARRGRATGRDA